MDDLSGRRGDILLGRKGKKTNAYDYETKADVLAEMNERQLHTRVLFWRLFEDKFTHPYWKFLTNVDVRKEIMHICPEALGPRCNGPPHDLEGKNFAMSWKASLTPFDRFFKTYEFHTPVTLEDIDVLIEKTKDDFPSNQENEPEDLHQWYIQQAAVLFLQSHEEHNNNNTTDESSDSDNSDYSGRMSELD
jgi:hypothetical protein